MRRYNLSPELPSMRSVGYRQVLEHLTGEYGREGMIERGIAATRQLRGDKDVHWLDEEGEDPGAQALKIIARTLKLIWSKSG